MSGEVEKGSRFSVGLNAQHQPSNPTSVVPVEPNVSSPPPERRQAPLLRPPVRRRRALVECTNEAAEFYPHQLEQEEKKSAGLCVATSLTVSLLAIAPPRVRSDRSVTSPLTCDSSSPQTTVKTPHGHPPPRSPSFGLGCLPVMYRPNNQRRCR